MNTMQQEFDAVVAHLYKQGLPAKSVEGYCAYRGENGTMCAVGCRIPDSAYHPDMETASKGGTIGNVLLNFPGVLPGEVVAYKAMFRDLQKVHDSTYITDAAGRFDKAMLGRRLKDVADHFGLTFTEPQQGA